jgi:thiamine-phosphate pyrophosphorylase
MLSLPNTLYITDNDVSLDNLQYAYHEHGVRFVQVRSKTLSLSELKERITLIRKEFGAGEIILTLNDDPVLAAELRLDGVHLGRSDVSVRLAREVLGDNKIIGVTINNVFDLQEVSKDSNVNEVSYLSFGPLRSSTTKSNLSPLLGFPGVSRLREEQVKLQLYSLPSFVVGGVELADRVTLQSLGVYGIAASKALYRRT